MAVVDRKKPLIPVTYAQIILRMAAKQGFDRHRIEAQLGFGITNRRLRGLVSRLSLAQYEQLARTVIAAVEESGYDTAGLGYELGLSLAPMTHGTIGHALVSQTSARRATNLFLRFAPLILPGVRLRLHEANGLAVLDVKEEFELSSDLYRHFYDMVLSALWRSIRAAVNPDRSRIEIWFDYPEPACFPRYRDRLPVCRFDAGANQIRGPAEYLDRRLLTGDAIAGRELEEQCERELQLLDDGRNVVDRVRAVLKSRTGGYPGLETVGAELCMATSTLRRRLNQQGTSFQKLLDEARCEEAKYLLESTAGSIETIAIRLGYSDPANFTHAFRKWTGTAPSSWRNLRSS